MNVECPPAIGVVAPFSPLPPPLHTTDHTEQLDSVQPLPSWAIVTDYVHSNKNLYHNEDHNQEGGNRTISVPNFMKTCAFVRYNIKL